jgi:hypothetical protein
MERSEIRVASQAARPIPDYAALHPGYATRISGCPMRIVAPSRTLSQKLKLSGAKRMVEAAMLIGLSQFQRGELLATILIFRVFDFFLPLLLATLMFGLRELRLLARRAAPRIAEPIMRLIL